MRTVTAATAELVALLRAAGFAASVDPAELNPNPACVWVQPRDIRDRTLGDTATLVVWCYLIVGNTETPDALRLLDDALAGLLELADPADSDDVIDLTAAVILPGNPGTPLPAFRMATDLDL